MDFNLWNNKLFVIQQKLRRIKPQWYMMAIASILLLSGLVLSVIALQKPQQLQSKAATGDSQYIGRSCTTPQGNGTCQYLNSYNCTGQGGQWKTGYCPGSSNVVCCVVPKQPPPTSVTTNNCPAPGTTFKINWTLPSGYTYAYPRIYDETTGGTYYPGPMTGTSYSISTTPGHRYSYWVHTTNAAGSPYSTEVPTARTATVTCNASPPQPPPTNVSASCSAPGTTFKVTWTPVSGYSWYYLRIFDETTGAAATYPAQMQATSYSWPNAIPGHRYSYWVHTTNAAGSPYSTEVPTARTATVTCYTPPPLKIYMSPTGSNNNSGLTNSSPVRTLEKVENIIKAANPTTNVQVIINQGTYSVSTETGSGMVDWNTYIPGHTITFMPPSYTPGAGCPTRPIFIGNNQVRWWFVADGASVNTNLRFYCLQVQNFPIGGIIINGGTTLINGYRRPNGTGANGNTIHGMLFQNMGTKYVTPLSSFGQGGVLLQNSSNNVLSSNIYQNLINNTNSSNDQHKVHGIYIAHGSSNNEVKDSYFAYISGNPVQVRNDANNNNTHHNTFTKTGHNGYLSEYVRAGSEASGGDKDCASGGNILEKNTLVGTNYEGRTSTYYVVYPNSTVGKDGPCGDPGTRHTASGNVRQ